MIWIGPHRFTATDAQATLRHADDLFNLLVDGVDPVFAGLAAPFRVTAMAVLGRPLDEALEASWMRCVPLVMRCVLRAPTAPRREERWRS